MQTLPDEKIRCHRLERTCRAGVIDQYCQLWINVRGHDPQTGQEVDRYGCADSFMPMLTIECAQQTRQAAAAIESFRNEVVKANEAAVRERNAMLERVGGRFLAGSNEG